jgi:hypothetical protein
MRETHDDDDQDRQKESEGRSANDWCDFIKSPEASCALERGEDVAPIAFNTFGGVENPPNNTSWMAAHAVDGRAGWRSLLAASPKTNGQDSPGSLQKQIHSMEAARASGVPSREASAVWDTGNTL